MGSRLFLRYWIVISVLLTLLLVAGGGLEMFFAYRENIVRIEAIQRAEVRLVAGRIAGALKSIEESIVDAASLPWHERLLDLEDARQEFHRLLKLAKPIYELRARGPDGRTNLLVSRKEKDAVGAAAAAAAPGPRPPKDGYQPIRYQSGSQPFTTLVVAVPSPAGLFSAIEADLNLSFASDVIGDSSAAQSRSVYVLDAEDNLVAHTVGDLVRARQNFSDLPHVSAIRAALASSKRATSSERSADHSGNRIVASGMAIGDSGWMAFVEEPQSRLYQDALSTARRTAVMIVAALLAAVVASYLLARRLSRPIIELRRGAERISRGDLSTRIEAKTGDEIEALAQDFNAMAAQLQEYTTGLERKVDEKTAELRAADRHKSSLLERLEKERAATEHALQLAREAMRARALFLAAASHDLRQPLHAISILADTLMYEPLSESGTRVLQKQRGAIEVLRHLFDNLLDLSRFDAGEIRPVPRTVSLRELALPIAAEHEVLCHAKGLSWRCDLPDCWVETDPSLLRRILANLLSNAVRYTAVGGVELRARLDDGLVTLEVADTGIGIAPEDQARVFDEFVQLSNPGRNRDEGVGLGLSIVKRISALLDARLRMESKPGEGTQFTLQLHRAAHDGEHTSQPLGTPAYAELRRIRLWVVEDDAMVRDAIALQLVALGVEFDFALDRPGLEMLRMRDGDWPDAIMLDDMLGDRESGLQVAQWLARSMETMRILIVTGNVDPNRAQELDASGFHVLRKPVASADLLAWLARLGGRVQA